MLNLNKSLTSLEYGLPLWGWIAIFWICVGYVAMGDRKTEAQKAKEA